MPKSSRLSAKKSSLKFAPKAMRSTAKRSRNKRKKQRQKMNRAGRSGRMRKSAPGGSGGTNPLTSIANTIQDVVPQLWNGIRGIFNFKAEDGPQEALSATPASLQMVVANQAYEGIELPCEHPTLGVKGILISGSQFLCQTQWPVQGASGIPNYLITDGSFAGALYNIGSGSSIDGLAFAAIPVNLWNFGGMVARKAYLYQRSVIRRLRVRLVSTCGVSQTGITMVGYFKDWTQIPPYIAGASLTVPLVADLVPSIAVPNQVPQSSMEITYDGPELYYLGRNLGAPYAATNPAIGVNQWGDAQNRQEIQGGLVFKTDSGTVTDLAMPLANVYIDYVAELYDPLPEGTSVPASLTELRGVVEVLAYLRGYHKVDPPKMGPRKEEVRLQKVLSLLKPVEVAEFGQGAPLASFSDLSPTRPSTPFEDVPSSSAAAAVAPRSGFQSPRGASVRRS